MAQSSPKLDFEKWVEVYSSRAALHPGKMLFGNQLKPRELSTADSVTVLFRSDHIGCDEKAATVPTLPPGMQDGRILVEEFFHEKEMKKATAKRVKCCECERYRAKKLTRKCAGKCQRRICSVCDGDKRARLARLVENTQCAFLDQCTACAHVIGLSALSSALALLMKVLAVLKDRLPVWVAWETTHGSAIDGSAIPA